MTAEAEERLRAVCLAFPEATEKVAWDHPTWRVRERIFAMFTFPDGRASACLKAPPGAQEILVGAAPARFFLPAYVGPKGWVGVRLDDGADWAEVAALVRRSYRLTAPKTLAAKVSE